MIKKSNNEKVIKAKKLKKIFIYCDICKKIYISENFIENIIIV